uniref:FLYWCH-type domain-containing protein n=2 Tax=Lutzomyia longipalpis TaxID=7200 RepID=A0A1B0GHA6_LUTLO
MLVHDGYRYVSNRESSKHIFWRCSRYVKYHCRATVVTSKNNNAPSIRISGPEHTHEPEMQKDMQYLNLKEEHEKKLMT